MIVQPESAHSFYLGLVVSLTVNKISLEGMIQVTEGSLHQLGARGKGMITLRVECKCVVAKVTPVC